MKQPDGSLLQPDPRGVRQILKTHPGEQDRANGWKRLDGKDLPGPEMEVDNQQEAVLQVWLVHSNRNGLTGELCQQSPRVAACQGSASTEQSCRSSITPPAGRSRKQTSANATVSSFQKVGIMLHIPDSHTHTHTDLHTPVFHRSFCGVKILIFVGNLNILESWADVNMMDGAWLRKQKHSCKHKVLWSGLPCGILRVFVC